MIHGLMVVRNEEERYLEASLRWNLEQFDTLSVVDDRSDDLTAEIAERYADHVLVNPWSPFLFNEGEFRENCWDWWLGVCDPDRDDWLVSVDADEFMTGDLRLSLDDHPGTSASLRVHEVWGLSPVVVRVDGWWSRGTSPRCVQAGKVLGGFKFPHKVLGSGSLPRGFAGSSLLHGSEIMHFGYAEKRDRKAKYDRYRHDRNHGPRHVESIMKVPTVLEWTGQVIDFE